MIHCMRAGFRRRAPRFNSDSDSDDVSSSNSSIRVKENRAPLSKSDNHNNLATTAINQNNSSLNANRFKIPTDLLNKNKDYLPNSNMNTSEHLNLKNNASKQHSESSSISLSSVNNYSSISNDDSSLLVAGILRSVSTAQKTSHTSSSSSHSSQKHQVLHPTPFLSSSTPSDSSLSSKSSVSQVQQFSHQSALSDNQALKISSSSRIIEAEIFGAQAPQPSNQDQNILSSKSTNLNSVYNNQNPANTSVHVHGNLSSHSNYTSNALRTRVIGVSSNLLSQQFAAAPLLLTKKSTSLSNPPTTSPLKISSSPPQVRQKGVLLANSYLSSINSHHLLPLNSAHLPANHESSKASSPSKNKLTPPLNIPLSNPSTQQVGIQKDDQAPLPTISQRDCLSIISNPTSVELCNPSEEFSTKYRHLDITKDRSLPPYVHTIAAPRNKNKNSSNLNNNGLIITQSNEKLSEKSAFIPLIHLEKSIAEVVKETFMNAIASLGITPQVNGKQKQPTASHVASSDTIEDKDKILVEHNIEEIENNTPSTFISTTTHLASPARHREISPISRPVSSVSVQFTNKILQHKFEPTTKQIIFRPHSASLEDHYEINYSPKQYKDFGDMHKNTNQNHKHKSFSENHGQFRNISSKRFSSLRDLSYVPSSSSSSSASLHPAASSSPRMSPSLSPPCINSSTTARPCEPSPQRRICRPTSSLTEMYLQHAVSPPPLPMSPPSSYFPPVSSRIHPCSIASNSLSGSANSAREAAAVEAAAVLNKLRQQPVYIPSSSGGAMGIPLVNSVEVETAVFADDNIMKPEFLIDNHANLGIDQKLKEEEENEILDSFLLCSPSPPPSLHQSRDHFEQPKSLNYFPQSKTIYSKKTQDNQKQAYQRPATVGPAPTKSYFKSLPKRPSVELYSASASHRKWVQKMRDSYPGIMNITSSQNVANGWTTAREGIETKLRVEGGSIGATIELCKEQPTFYHQNNSMNKDTFKNLGARKGYSPVSPVSRLLSGENGLMMIEDPDIICWHIQSNPDHSPFRQLSYKKIEDNNAVHEIKITEDDTNNNNKCPLNLASNTSKKESQTPSIARIPTSIISSSGSSNLFENLETYNYFDLNVAPKVNSESLLIRTNEMHSSLPNVSSKFIGSMDDLAFHQNTSTKHSELRLPSKVEQDLDVLQDEHLNTLDKLRSHAIQFRLMIESGATDDQITLLRTEMERLEGDSTREAEGLKFLMEKYEREGV